METLGCIGGRRGGGGSISLEIVLEGYLNLEELGLIDKLGHLGWLDFVISLRGGYGICVSLIKHMHMIFLAIQILFLLQI